MSEEPNTFLTIGNKAGVTTYGHRVSLSVGARNKFRSAETILITDSQGVIELSADEALVVGQAMVEKARAILGAKAAELASPHPPTGRSPLVNHDHHVVPKSTKKQAKPEAHVDAQRLMFLRDNKDKNGFIKDLDGVIANKQRTNRDLKAICKTLVGSSPRAPISKAKIRAHILDRVWG